MTTKASNDFTGVHFIFKNWPQVDQMCTGNQITPVITKVCINEISPVVFCCCVQQNYMCNTYLLPVERIAHVMELIMHT